MTYETQPTNQPERKRPMTNNLKHEIIDGRIIIEGTDSSTYAGCYTTFLTRNDGSLMRAMSGSHSTTSVEAAEHFEADARALAERLAAGEAV